ncbi:Ger(x)C family spore germination protein [Clostridium magnum]|uniref:Spore germination protein B3 n=1 Tax=Clostridium magnum DSM 2767 TaxID=1121326 RepID=A0A161WQV3_9CLOT|nr:Ger(x)C family spore germination protein [Clostridium magnum]KZL89058.1 spore germination protein B3 precursor [Clostridium magnum DSM 2767]SHI30187.1 spore germination protein KC [Clostridium magnum DSM 2767]
MFVRRISILILIIITMQLFTGCTDVIEVNNIAIVAGVGLDKTDDGQIIFTLLIPVTRATGFGGLMAGGTSAEKESRISISEKGYGIMDAYREIEKKLSRKIFLSQNKAIFIGEKLAREGISEVIDFFYRHPESHLKASMFFVEGQASEMLSMKSLLERSIVEKFIKSEKLEVGMRTSLKDFLNMMTEEGVEPVGAKVKPKQLEVTKDPKKASGIEGAAVFNKNKLIGWISGEETRGALWLRNEIKRGVVTTNISDEKKGGKLAVEIIKAKTKVKPILKGSEVEMEVKVYTEGSIYENSSNLDLSNSEEIHFVEGRVSEDIKEKIQLALEKTQKQLKSDILGFGTAVYREYPKEWNNYYKKNWDEEFPKVKVKVTCDVRIVDVGLQSKVLTSN